MCKVFAIPGLKKENHKDAQKLLKEATKIMSKTDSDGLGYAAITKDGSIYGERWVKNSDAFENRDNPVKPEPTEGEMFLKANFGVALKNKDDNTDYSPVYEGFGTMNSQAREDTVAVVLHARKKTQGEVSLSNTHPFYEIGNKDYVDTAIIHNGSINNHDKLEKKYSTCDSETILHKYLEYCTNYCSNSIENISEDLKGVYTCCVLSSTNDQTKKHYPILDLFKSNKPLVCGYIEEWGTPIFATNKEIIEGACKETGLTVTDLFEMEDGFFIRINAVTGQLDEEIIAFEPSARTEYASNGYNTTRTNNNSATNVNNYTSTKTHTTPDTSTGRTVASARQEFENDFKSIFDNDYCEISDATEEEKKIIADLEKIHNPSQRALALVKNAVGYEN